MIQEIHTFLKIPISSDIQKFCFNLKSMYIHGERKRFHMHVDPKVLLSHRFNLFIQEMKKGETYPML